MKIMIVDDEQDARALYLQYFRKEIKSGEIDLQYAPSGEEAIGLLEEPVESPIQMVFSDINMPGMDGFELLKKIKEKFKKIKVIMVSAYGNEDFKSNAYSLGASGFFTKPVDFRLLRETIHQELSPTGG